MRITNNGNYDAVVTFALSSTLLGEELPPGKSPFIIEPEIMNLKVDQTEELTVWAFPEEAKEYRDELVCLVKDNPTPSVFPMICTGSKP